MNVAKVQHYVPQFLLRNFASGKNDQLHVFDKRDDRVFLTNAKNIASESRFYDFQIEGAELTLEPELALLETRTKPIVDRMIESDSFALGIRAR